MELIQSGYWFEIILIILIVGLILWFILRKKKSEKMINNKCKEVLR